MKTRPSEQIYMTVLRASMRVMLVSRENCSQRPHKSNTLAWGTPHSDLCGGRTSEIKVSHSLSPLQVKTTIKHRRNPRVVEVWSVTETFRRTFSHSIHFNTVSRPSLGVIGDALFHISRFRMRWMRSSFLLGHIVTRDKYDQNNGISVFHVIYCFITS
jgi:hypothetical protein